MKFTAWTLLTDVGLLGGLLLVGMLVRAKLGVAQRLLLPASVVGGALGLVLGPNVLRVLPFSDQLAVYPSVLIVVVFAALPLQSSVRASGGFGRAVGRFLGYSVASYTLQFGLGLLFALLVLGQFWDLPAGFGVMLAAGWAGGFGTAAAMGTTFAGQGWAEATSLGFTSATVGTLVGTVGGIALSYWGASTGRISGLPRFADLPASMRTGLIDAEEEREPIGQATVSSSSVESLMVQLGIVAAVSAAGYGVTKLVALAWPSLSVPVFAVAFLISALVRAVLGRTACWRYVCTRSMRSVSGTATDVLVVTGIASIVPAYLRGYVAPLAVLMAFGLVFCLVMFRVVGPWALGQGWVERALFTWGWATAALFASMALLRMIDPKLRGGTVEEYGAGYVLWAPVEIASVTFVPLLIGVGLTWVVVGGWTAIGLAGLALVAVLARTRARTPSARETAREAS
ncbi:sodium/glutamate symporter [Pseudonocardia acaciae]|uniref:sodium/glutamate symporter n=1 Tax=Pseudonocardia acaciae TaxID=551276 RepID=UPI00048B53E1|nr:sodium:glutamate symporter [Pseudonocardia acaciae]